MGQGKERDLEADRGGGWGREGKTAGETEDRDWDRRQDEREEGGRESGVGKGDSGVRNARRRDTPWVCTGDKDAPHRAAPRSREDVPWTVVLAGG